MLKSSLYKELLKNYQIDWENWEREIKRYIDLLKYWNPIAGLVSPGELEKDCVEQIEDSLSLTDYIIPYLEADPGLIWLDIGSGGGFPAVPILLAFKKIRIILIERKIRKTGFLQLVIKKFNFENAKVICDTFPDCIPKFSINSEDIGIITARGVEQPTKLAKYLSHWLSPKTIFLCQSPKVDSFFPQEKFSLHQVEDEWSNLNPPLRKGRLVLIQRKA